MQAVHAEFFMARMSARMAGVSRPPKPGDKRLEPGLEADLRLGVPVPVVVPVPDLVPCPLSLPYSLEVCQ